jgi:hypothetical protein
MVVKKFTLTFPKVHNFGKGENSRKIHDTYGTYYQINI